MIPRNVERYAAEKMGWAAEKVEAVSDAFYRFDDCDWSEASNATVEKKLRRVAALLEAEADKS